MEMLNRRGALTAQQVAVYEALLAAGGEASAGELAKSLPWNSYRVGSTMTVLRSKGLVVATCDDHWRRRWAVVDAGVARWRSL